ncbi:MAG: glycosyltransferase family 2 protein [Atribacterota bacterium]
MSLIDQSDNTGNGVNYKLNLKKDLEYKDTIIAIIPAFNEEKNIREVIQKCKDYVHKIIVIDDGSRDNTADIAKNMGVTTIVNEQNIGKTGSLKKGFNRGIEENAKIFVLLDADGQHNPQEIPLFLKKIEEGFDLVIGARNFDSEVMPGIRILANSISSYLVSLICGVRIEDSQSGYRAAKREVLEKITLNSKRFQVDTEMIIKAAKCGFKIGFVSIDTIYHPEAKSKVNQILDPVRFVILLVQLAFWRKKAGDK